MPIPASRKKCQGYLTWISNTCSKFVTDFNAGLLNTQKKTVVEHLTDHRDTICRPIGHWKTLSDAYAFAAH